MSDRARPPCHRCGAELYDKYFGNGGWMPTEVESGRAHHHDDCAKRLAADVTAELASVHAECTMRGMHLKVANSNLAAERARCERLVRALRHTGDSAFWSFAVRTMLQPGDLVLAAAAKGGGT